MAKRRGFWADLQHERAQKQREAERANRAALQEARSAQREAERRQRAARQREAADVRERKRLHIEERKATAQDMNERLDERVTELEGVLLAGIRQQAGLSFESLKRVVDATPFDPRGQDRPTRAPEWGDFAPPEPGWLTRKLGLAGNRDATEAKASRAFDDSVAEHLAAEKQRKRHLYERRRAYEHKVAADTAAVEEHNAEIDRFEHAVRQADPEAVARYFDLVLDASPYPHGFPHQTELSYLPERQQLVVEYELPPLEVIPTEKENRYVQSRDEIVVKPRPDKEVRQRYRDVIAQVTLRTLHEVFMADSPGVIDAVNFGGKLSAVDKATGQPIRPMLVNVTAERAKFEELVLTDLDPAACLKHLNALISPHPYDLEAVRPVVDFEALLAMHHLVDGADVMAGVDSRTDLLEMTPTEFEHFTRELFEEIGMKSWNTRDVKDDGVDAVAVNEDPVLSGLCIIQAKRYRGAIGVNHVRELIGAMDDKNATKGILVTTSWVTSDGHDLAQRNGKVEILEGEHIKHLCKELLDKDILIGLPKPPPRRRRKKDFPGN